jgi:hypothetical protein
VIIGAALKGVNIVLEIPWGGLLIKQYSGISMGMGQTDMWNFHGGG